MNRLAEESSPYLRQHRNNPVDWYPWGDEAFARAKAEDRPVLLSVGYSACHWCHVMAHESFEDDEVAAVMNELFVNVKVDREERPDVDSVYMDAVQQIHGHGGWPMTVFLAPDGKPFFGGTYFPKDNFLTLLRAVDEAWRTQRAELQQQAEGLTRTLAETARIEPAADLPGVEQLNKALNQIGSNFDPEWGGFGGAPKFPSTMNLELVLRAHLATASPEALEVVTTSLDAMASGGMYDHLGGGFARYSVDARWLVPHFEKMLYDQALLARVYLHAWQSTGHERWRQVLSETIEYVLRDLRSPHGGFYSAEDADSDGREGAFYVWTPAQIRAVLDDATASRAIAWWGVTDGGNFEGDSILNRMHARGQFARPADIEAARAALFAHRATRVRPGLDDKVLTEWNALMIATLAEAGAAAGEPRWVEAAVGAADLLCNEVRRPDGRWHRSWQADVGARHEALAADHAALLEAFVALAQATGEARWIDEARGAADALVDRFWDVERGGVFTTADDGEELVARQKDVMDNATPSANSMAALGLLRLAALTGETRYQEHADQILRLLADVVLRAPTAFGHLLAAVDLRRQGATEIAVVGDAPDLVRVVHQCYLPNGVLAWGEPYDSPLWEGRRDGYAYVCRDYRCEAPVDTDDALVAVLTGLAASDGEPAPLE
jgi:uncharacterized protein YyaL (SSP411 family)